MCSICNKNIAVVFITKIVDGKQIQEGLCISCAKKQKVGNLDKLIEQTGMSEEEIDDLNKQMSNMFEEFESNTQDSSQDNILSGMGALFDLFKNPKNSETKSTENINDNKQESQSNSTKKESKKRKYLDYYGVNLTEKAKNQEIDNIVGRAKEIERVIQILNRRNKNNPVLIGEPGVGKTAIAEGLALNIAKGNVPYKLLKTEVYMMDFTSIIAGTQFRGQFESRMKGIIEEAKNAGNIILVIDELHNIMGSGDSEGVTNAANILKPVLAKGEIQVLGSTTLNEYRKHIEKDTALERRFQPVIVEEPSIDETIQILTGIKGHYESYHKIKIDDDVINAAVNFSKRYITDRFLPDKAIDLLDEAGSRANLNNKSLIRLANLKDEVTKVQEEIESKQGANSIEDYQRIADLRIEECKLLNKIKQFESKEAIIPLTVDDIAEVVELWTKIPVKNLKEKESKKLLELENRIHERIIGQNEAVSSISKAIRRSRADFKSKKRPTSFIFVGPTGVGKTELVKELAKQIFGTEEALIRFDMSEYMEKHASSKLIGAPPGYVGYGDSGQLTEKVRRKPYSIILLDEIEKAHPDLFNMLLQIMEDGRLTDSHGKVVNFENTILIMTSNAGTNFKSAGLGFGADNYIALETKVRDVLKETFRPEFLNRVDDIIVFKELTKVELKNIVDIMLKDVINEAEVKDIKINVTESAKEFILEKGYDIKYGARPLRRTIQKYIEDELAELFLKGVFGKGDTVFIDFEKETVVFKLIKEGSFSLLKALKQC